MFKANICKTKQRQFGQVPILKSFILKEPKFMDLWRSLLKTSLLYYNILIQGLFSSFFFLLFKLRNARFTEVRFKQFIFMSNT